MERIVWLSIGDETNRIQIGVHIGHPLVLQLSDVDALQASTSTSKPVVSLHDKLQANVASHYGDDYFHGECLMS